MTNLTWLSRRRLLRSTALTATAPTLSDQFIHESDSIPPADSVESYVGVSELSYQNVSGELSYRTIDENPDNSKDCIYSIRQDILAQDADVDTPNTGEPAFLDASYELRVVPTATPADPPPTYQNFATIHGDLDIDNSTEVTSESTRSRVSIGAYPGLRFHFSSTDTSDQYRHLRYGQSLPWGAIFWRISYHPELEISFHTDEFQTFLHRRRYRDWNKPSISTKSYWKSLHTDNKTEKGRFSGDIADIVAAADDEHIDRSALQRVDDIVAEEASVDPTTVISFE